MTGAAEQSDLGNGARSRRNADKAAKTRDTDIGDCRPGFILCPARSGSTLLRLILNSHPEIACPPETNLVEIFGRIGFAVAAANDLGHPGGDLGASPEATRQALAVCREVADEIVGAYARDRGKRIWVDKSLPSALFADLLAKVYPEGRFICLYRQCADTVASLQEASRWSYEAFGVLPFVQANPVNLVQALTAYWVERVSLLQAFEHAHPDLALRVRYEDLVSRPDEIVSQIIAFLGATTDEAALASTLQFQRNPSAVIPGDLNARFSKGIDPRSVGRGWNVPFEMLTPDLRERVDELSRELRYRPLPNLRKYTTEPATPILSAVPADGTHSEAARRLLEGHLAAPNRASAPVRNRDSEFLKLVLTDLPEAWMVDLTTGQLERRDGESGWLALTDSETLLDLVAGRANPGMAMRNSVLQVVSASEQAIPDQFLDCVDQLMTLLRA